MLAADTNNQVLDLGFRPVKISKTATLMLDATIENIFPLFGPVKEMEWADGWNPEMLYGSEEIQERCIFRTPSKFAEEPYYQWLISKFNADRHFIEYTVTGVDRIWFISVECKSYQDATLAIVTYTYIGLTALAHSRNRQSLENMYAQNLSDWEEAINYYLKTGKKLKH